MNISVGECTGKTTLKTIPMDDFQMILGMDFQRGAKHVPMPHLDSVSLYGESTYMIPIVWKKKEPTMQKGKEPEQLKKGLKNGDDTFLLAPLMEDQVANDAPRPHVIKIELKKFSNIMLAALPKGLPP